ncbi:MAG: GntR family transcriptional regulator [Roseibaca calidilacus]|uniref:GntR family transcriptional regulator n=1 Tax=Roseibaca calidilacus TaxID=1666912 RepID=A0A0P7YQD3_9RHOB|nr:GntR family transcriptional regulator [Roseibaca calidilacus]KPP92496.1 MAG: GntR family transcriptional regulator [Roseibaca calidilacus]CUX79793.1 GntR family transcriptional regulator [Roseibaca calidilacus]
MDDAPSGALPRYQQISELLIRDIAAGRLMDGARLAPEREMAADLGVAVGTLRKALQDLAEKGLLERVQGSGNYIRAQPEVASIYALFRLELVAGGGLPSAEVLEVTRCAKPAHLPEFGSGAEAHRIRRLRLLSGQPAAVEEIWLDAAYAPELRADELSQSLYLHYRTRLGLWIARAEDRIGTGTVPKFAPARFGLRPGAVAGHIQRISWSQDNRRAEVSETWFDPNVARYVSRLK